ncbi:hypothetical protein QU487_04070 [Crenobacter sp. SG2305]|uniref:hypothetical protein n=1 Tax=Crenobacter oryzisoli TaxID=3056844 RepID=UPI0025AB0EC8|nr:hypothetical protein [Crenobacter sp. SG2305]MDN0081931.1 hypothetical protein [Crenobacter sp. SG2305]
MPELCDICHARPVVARVVVMQDGQRRSLSKAIDLIDQAVRVRIRATSRPTSIQGLEVEIAQLRREQDFATSRKSFDEANNLIGAWVHHVIAGSAALGV